MGYKISYNKEFYRRYRFGKFPYNTKGIIVVICTFLAILITCCLPFRSWLLEWILPANMQLTKSAFSDLVFQVQEGESVMDAVTTFGKAVIHNE